MRYKVGEELMVSVTTEQIRRIGSVVPKNTQMQKWGIPFIGSLKNKTSGNLLWMKFTSSGQTYLLHGVKQVLLHYCHQEQGSPVNKLEDERGENCSIMAVLGDTYDKESHKGKCVHEAIIQFLWENLRKSNEVFFPYNVQFVFWDWLFILM